MLTLTKNVCQSPWVMLAGLSPPITCLQTGSKKGKRILQNTNFNSHEQFKVPGFRHRSTFRSNNDHKQAVTTSASDLHTKYKS